MDKCPECGGKLGVEAIKCRCGWSAASQVREPRTVPCCFVGCIEKAMCRVWTKTGWADVCVTHYQEIEIVPRPVHSPAVDEIRKSVSERRDDIAHER